MRVVCLHRPIFWLFGGGGGAMFFFWGGEEYTVYPFKQKMVTIVFFLLMVLFFPFRKQNTKLFENSSSFLGRAGGGCSKVTGSFQVNLFVFAMECVDIYGPFFTDVRLNQGDSDFTGFLRAFHHGVLDKKRKKNVVLLLIGRNLVH